MKKINEIQSQKELEKGYKKAEKLITNKKDVTNFLEKIEVKINNIKIVGSTLSIIPTMILLVKSYINKEYTKIPVNSIIAIISALIYFLTPIDLIPDIVLGLGFLDDATVISTCLKMVKNDIDEYKEWKSEHNK